MDLITNTSTAYGSVSWAERTTMYLGGSDNWANRITFPSLSGGSYIEDLIFAFYKTNTQSYTATVDCYSTTNASIVGNNITDATFLGSYTFSGIEGTKNLWLDRAAVNVIQAYTGTWYFLMKGRTTDTRTTWTGGQGTEGCVMAVLPPTKTIQVKAGGVWKAGVPYVKVGGVWRVGYSHIKIAGYWQITY